MIRKNRNKLADLQVIWHMSIALLDSVILIVIIIIIIMVVLHVKEWGRCT